MHADTKTVQTTSIALLAKLISVTDYLGHARKQGIPAGQAIANLLQDDTAIATLAKGDGEGALRHATNAQTLFNASCTAAKYAPTC